MVVSKAGTTAASALRTLVLGLGLLLAGPTPGLGIADARADFRVCNESPDTVGVAIGYRDEDGWISEGWWHVDGDACETLISGTLTSRFYYLYAENAERSRRWGGDIRMCTAEEEFKIVGVRDCIARGHARMGFGEYDTGDEPSWTVKLTPAENAAVSDGSEGVAESEATPVTAAN